jgi:DNA-binding MarR family transcriptional regulator
MAAPPPEDSGSDPGPDEVIHQSTRLRLMGALKGLPEGEPIEFPRLKEIMKLTDGNLGAHLSKLSEAGYITVAKDESDRRTRTLITLTGKGRLAFARHIEFLKSIIEE